VSTDMSSSVFRSGKSRAVAICAATALAMVAISSVSALHASDDPVTSGKTEYIQPKSYDVNNSYKSYAAAAQLMDGAAVVYRPTYTAGLKRTSKVKVVSNDLEVTNGKIVGGETYVGASYGTKAQGFTVHEKLVGTDWRSSPEEELFFCAGIEMCNPEWWRDFPTLNPEWGKVGNVKLTVGEPDTTGVQSTVIARVYAKCGVKSSTSQPQEAADLRCEKSDVVNGGLVSYTVKKSGSESKNVAADDKAKTGTNVVVEAKGINFDELTNVASSMQPAPTPTVDINEGLWQLLVPISHRSTCREGIESGTLADARQIAKANGLRVEITSIDGIPQMVTGDWRTDRVRFTVVGGRVVDCSYG
jgi:hypothetical protein